MNSKIGDSLAAVWTTRIGQVAQQVNVTLGKARQAPDWAKVALLMVENTNRIADDNSCCDETALQSDTSDTNSSSKRSYTTASSKTDSYPLSEEAKKSFEAAYKSMSDGKKWMFNRDDGSVGYVEDVMFRYGQTCDYEQLLPLPRIPAACEQIIDQASAIIDQLVSDDDGLDDQQLAKKVIDTLQEALDALGPYDPYKEFDQHWLVRVLQDFLSYYRWNVFARLSVDCSETDLVSRVWSLFDKCFDNLGIDTKR
ncbi:hypothetical protein BX666DRAFT_974506 [Dichotomocladium elegans]|nr:hypothetical protein BX666DRAFT_974506 [Dichotomocladium elegans]